MFDLGHFLKIKAHYFDNALIQKKMRQQLVQMLGAYGRREFAEVFEFGVAQGEFTRLLVEQIHFRQYIANDINNYGIYLKSLNSNIYQCYFDMQDIQDTPIWDKRFDLIASNATLQWLPFKQTMQNLYHLLKPNGVVLLSSFGEKNFIEIRELMGVGLDYVSLEDIKAEIMSNFKILELQEEVLGLTFSNTLEVFRHIRNSGGNALGEYVYLSRDLLERYEKMFNNHLSYHPIYILAYKR